MLELELPSWISSDKTLQDFWRKGILIGTVIISIGLLGYYKYINFFIENWNSLFIGLKYESLVITEFKTVALPLGISFYTFHALSYTIDVYLRQLKTEKNVINFATYVVMFPQLVAGPIVRYRDIYSKFYNRVIKKTEFANGVRRFIVGLAKKVLIANTVAKAADGIFALPSDQISFTIAWLGIIAYTLQIYFDFSGYSDMAIGLGLMFGFRYKENFIYPYISQSIGEFWRRWHISLSSWLRDYLYIPLGGNRRSRTATYLNLLIVFFLCGLWHGANWTFVIWGLWHGLFLIIEKIEGPKCLLNGLYRPVRHAYVIFVVMLGWVFFRADTVDKAFSYIGILLGLSSHPSVSRNIFEFLQFDVLIAICFGFIAATNIITLVHKMACRKLGLYSIEFSWYRGLMMTTVFGLFLLSLMSLSNGYYNPFIYFRF